MFFPDDQIGWLPFALASAIRAHRVTPFDAVYSTSSPITSHLVAGILCRLTGLPWVAEFRDPWLGNALAAPLPWLHRRLQVKLERWIVRSADRIVFVTPSLTRMYQRRYPAAAKMVTITNGYDRSEGLQRQTERDAVGRFQLVYTGSLDRPAEFAVFLEGLAALLARRPDLKERLEVTFYGTVADECRAIADSHTADGLPTILRFIGFVPRREALQALADADAALLLMGSGPGMELFATGKLYDYIGQDRQVLAMLPRGDARAVLEGLDWGVLCDPNPADVARAIEDLLTAPAPDRRADPAGVYDRAVLVGQLATSLDEAMVARKRWPRGGRTPP